MAYYIITSNNATLKDTSLKVSFPYKCSDGDIVLEVKKCRTYKTFYMNTDSINNENNLRQIRAYLSNIKLTGDSLNGALVKFTDNTPYKYYLQTIQICNELPPKLFLPYLNQIYAFGKSKYRMTQDSIERSKPNAQNIETIEITGQVNN